MRRSMPGLLLFTFGLPFSAAHAGVLVPEWSRPLDAEVVSTAVGANTFNTEHLFLLLADGRVLAVSAVDSLREVGRAPKGATALVSLPTAPRGASDIALIIAVRTPGACNFVAWNRNGQQLWRAAIPGMAGIDSLFFVGEGENRAEFCAWQRGEPWLIVVSKKLWQYSASAVRLKPGFVPRDALFADFDRDDVPELVFFDGRRLDVYHPQQGRELRCQWPGPQLAGRISRPLIACAVFDSAPVLLVVTGDTLRYVDALTGDQKRRFGPNPASGLPGPPAAVVASGPTAYVAGTDRQGHCYVAKLATEGPDRPRMTLPLPVGGRVKALAFLKDWPMLQVSTGYGPEKLLICAPGLAGTADNSPGYSGVRFLRVVQLRIDEDTFPDLVVLRMAADARWRIDVFANRAGQLAEQLQQARRALLRAALGQNDNMVRRAVRRVRELERETGSGEAGRGPSVLDRVRATVRRRNSLTLVGALVVVLVSGGLGLLALYSLRRRAAPGQQIENSRSRPAWLWPRTSSRWTTTSCPRAIPGRQASGSSKSAAATGLSRTAILGGWGGPAARTCAVPTPASSTGSSTPPPPCLCSVSSGPRPRARQAAGKSNLSRPAWTNTADSNAARESGSSSSPTMNARTTTSGSASLPTPRSGARLNT